MTTTLGFWFCIRDLFCWFRFERRRRNRRTEPKKIKNRKLNNKTPKTFVELSCSGWVFCYTYGIYCVATQGHSDGQLDIIENKKQSKRWKCVWEIKLNGKRSRTNERTNEKNGNVWAKRRRVVSVLDKTNLLKKK